MKGKWVRWTDKCKGPKAGRTCLKNWEKIVWLEDTGKETDTAERQHTYIPQFSSVQSLSHVQLFATP